MTDRMDMKMALNAEIVAQGHSEDHMNRPVPPTVSTSPKKKRVANSSTTEWNMGASTGPGGTFREHWPDHLPRPPSMKKLTDAAESNAQYQAPLPQVIVFNANTQEGSSMVRVLSEKKLHVVAVVRVFTSRNTKNLTRLKNVTVKVADLNNFDAVCAAAQGCQQAFLLTKYWERFENPIEEHMAEVVIHASAEVGIQRLILATFEDTRELRLRGRKSQLMPTEEGMIYPKFEGMDAIDAMGRRKGVSITHMFTSYLDDPDSKKSLTLMRGDNGKIFTQSYIQDAKKE
jgi:hypothetical protein